MKKIIRPAMLAFAMALALPLIAQDYNLQLRSTVDFPGQELANICGYAQNGREYALIGAEFGMVVVDVTDPEKPVQIVQIPGPGSKWKEIKTLGHYAYVATEGGGGLQIVDLSKLPGANLDYHQYTGDGEIAGSLNSIHALHVDEVKKFVYLYGCGRPQSVGGGRLFSGGAVVLDLNADPYNPTYAGKFDQLGYLHDGFAYNDTLYGGHIYAGLLSIVDFTDKKNPNLLGSIQTPGKFTHNTWLLDDHKRILTTDEEFPSYLTAYDISDPSDIHELDRIARDEGTQSIGHNTHILNDWAITSWYIDGLTIVDAHRPINLVQVARFDTYASGGQFDGCWGVYPYLPSGNLLVTNILEPNGNGGRLFVLTPTYVRACYLEGKIIDGCNGQPLVGADVSINYVDPLAFTKSDNFGIFRTGQPTPGNFTATISKPGYISQTLNVTLKTAEVTELNVTLELNAAATSDVNATMVNASNGSPIAGTNFQLVNPGKEYEVSTDAAGHFDLLCAVNGAYRVGTWGYRVGDALIQNDGALNIQLEPEYYDDFELDLGWNTSETADKGLWEIGVPVGTSSGGQAVNPATDASGDNNGQCYVTGNGGGQSGNDDVDGGSVHLTTPPMQLSKYADPILTFWYWFYNGGGTGDPVNDKFQVQVSNGQQVATVLTQNASASQWRYSGQIHLKDFIAITDNVQVSFITADEAPGHLVEAALDIFRITPGVVGVNAPDETAQLALFPNPSASNFQLQFNWPDMKDVVLEVQNMLGQFVVRQSLGANSGALTFGDRWPAGVYSVVLRAEGRQSGVVKVVKQ